MLFLLKFTNLQIMKFVRTSSLLDDAILPRNASLNLNNNSQVLNESQFEQWRYKASCTSQRIHDRIWNYRQPLTSVEWTKQNVFCDFDNCTIEHKMRVAFRKCVEKANCPFEFRVIHCKFLKEFQIYQRHNHCHLILDLKSYLLKNLIYCIPIQPHPFTKTQNPEFWCRALYVF